MVVCAGLDLSASERKPSGVSIIEVGEDSRIVLLFAGSLYGDLEITNFILHHKASIVSIDAPLTRPKTSGHYRRVDLRAKSMGFKVLPLTWRGMNMLVNRAIKIADELRRAGLDVIETHPASSLKSSGCGSLSALSKALSIDIPGKLTRDEECGIVAGLVGVFYYWNKVFVIKDVDGEIYLLPRICY
jgi:predicted nuclease with RNAse H fold